MILDYKGGKIFYTDVGHGEVVVLLHGFLEDNTMWTKISPTLSKQKRIICIDLLGHGKTDCFGYVHRMKDMANAVISVINHLKIKKFMVIGHSMGGYVALEIAKQIPERLNGICLMNSTFEEDDVALKLRRSRANKIVKDNFENMVRLSFTNLFSDESQLNHEKEIEKALKIALQTSVQGYIAAQEGMALRHNSFKEFKDLSCKKLVIIGKKDPVISPNIIINSCKNTDIEVIKYSEGHMSHIENYSIFLRDIVHFIE
jgi:pimeloyl-ACP methyl ester carboxylesterase